MKKKLLLIAATHGNEKIGVEVIKKLERLGQNKYFNVLIGNPEALKYGKRFIDADLNRSYPGKRDSKIYEQRIAYNNMRIASQYEYIIDIHEASAGTDDFIIVPREEISKKFPLKFINLKNIIVWPDPKGPMGEVLENCIELEFGMRSRNREKAIMKATGVVSEFIDSVYGENESVFQQKSYYVYGKLMKSEIANEQITLKDLKLTRFQGEQFYPLLTNQYSGEGIICYKMRKNRQGRV